MRYFFVVLLVALVGSCDSSRVFENYIEYSEKAWPVQKPAKFDFSIEDTSRNYNLYYNIRNSLEFPYARLFIEYTLFDSVGNELSKKLLSEYLFDQKTGQPQGRSGLGDVYDHQFPLLLNYSFKNTGRYQIQLEQYSRQDTLQGILAVGVRVESVTEE